MFVVSGGVISMMSDDQPDTSQLLSGAALGGLIGSAASYIATGQTEELTKTLTAALHSGGSLMESVTPTSGLQDMKVGLPNF